jgi:transcriptional regulator with XRE-family HTH domain
MASNLKVERIKKDFTQDYLALKCGVSQGRISLVERGRISPTPKEAQRISQALNVPELSLFNKEADE